MSKYINLYKKPVITKPTRQNCNCEAKIHDLINNCTNCGRIVCSKEESGPCWFCNELVCTNDEFQMINNKSNNSQKLIKQLMSKSWPHDKITYKLNISLSIINTHDSEDSKLAEDRKQRLMEFDRTNAHRTKIIDDQSDYYQSENKIWTNPKNREVLRQKEEELRKERFTPKYKKSFKYTLDMKSGKLLEEKPNKYAGHELFEDPEIDSKQSFNSKLDRTKKINIDFLTYYPINKKSVQKSKKVENKRISNRNQDDQYI